jgi:hypothetical protein
LGGVAWGGGGGGLWFLVGSCQSCQEPVRTIRKSKSCQEASRILAPQQNADVIPLHSSPAIEKAIKSWGKLPLLYL